jgi:hypothetical protein
LATSLVPLIRRLTSTVRHAGRGSAVMPSVHPAWGLQGPRLARALHARLKPR